MSDITFTISPAISPQAIVELRQAVGWDGAENYPAALQGYWATVGGFDSAGKLIAWCAILSDGVRHAVLLDVIVHPSRQRQGIGHALVAKAIDHIGRHGITLIHVDFLPEHTEFYATCGFEVGLGGIIEL